MISGISTSTLEETNRLVYGTAKLVCEAVGPKGFGSTTRSTPPWKIRLNKKLLTATTAEPIDSFKRRSIT